MINHWEEKTVTADSMCKTLTPPITPRMFVTAVTLVCAAWFGEVEESGMRILVGRRTWLQPAPKVSHVRHIMIHIIIYIRVFKEKLVELGFLWSASYTKSIPTHQKLFAVGKSDPNATFNPIFLGLGWPWVGEFVGYIVTFICISSPNRIW